MPCQRRGEDQVQRRRYDRLIYDDVIAAVVIGDVPFREIPLLGVDISRAGVAVTTTLFVAKGTRIIMELEPPSPEAAPLRIPGVVARIEHIANSDRWKIGIAFAQE